MAPPLEISIPTTSLHTPFADSPSKKPYTLYNITIRLPLKSFVVQKRYSDFAALHQSLTSQVGCPPPAPLPAKSWFRSTVNSPELTEQRRQGLERYLRAIAEPPDRRWRDTSVWRAFLNLPSANGASVSGLSAEGRVPAIGLREANLAAASDPATWLDLVKEMKRELGVARAALDRRERVGEMGEQLEAEAQARKALIKAGSLMGPLEEGLSMMKEAGRLGAGEYNRRRDALEAAKRDRSLSEQLAAELARSGRGGREQGVASESGRAKLIPQTPVGRRLGKVLQETDETRERENVGVLQLNEDKIKEQDERVKQLGAVVHSLHRTGDMIHNELVYQVEMLDETNALADRVQRKVDVGNRRTKKL
ncbi:Phox-like protein [Parathielavia appendiculata]|uniref:Phox-like protein n=1 Tax=Parathielavia appendiculata TaxID=2587402 RepID=A0AAN6TZ05_9PEZI|nr:Phox-like protein [Parathielavia appendiculata]